MGELNVSILESIKNIVGVHPDYPEFDETLVLHVNTVLQLLVQKGIGKEGVFISDSTATWGDFLEDRQLNVRCVISWAGLKVKMLFDPPANGTLKQAYDENLKELEWMFYITENYIGEIGSDGSGKAKPYSGEIKNPQPYLYEISYDELDYDYAFEWFKKNHMPLPVSGCSSFKAGSFYGRNFDYEYNDNATFVVKTKSTVGAAGSIKGLSNDFVKSGKDSDLYKIVPFMLVDGINEHGVVCNTNLVPMQNGTTTGTVPTIEKQIEICSLMLPRYILDNFSSAYGAVTWLQAYASIYVPKGLQDKGYETHLMIADDANCYCIEFINNQTIIIEIDDNPKMTNFFLHDITLDNGKVYTPADVPSGHLPSVDNGITSKGSGLERYNLIQDNLDSVTSVETAFDLLKKLFYTNAYKLDTDPFWYSEFTGIENLTVDSPPADFSEIVNSAVSAFLKRKRNDGKTWQTTHSVVYDMDTKKMYMISQEFKDTIYEYSI